MRYGFFFCFRLVGASLWIFLRNIKPAAASIQQVDKKSKNKFGITIFSPYICNNKKIRYENLVLGLERFAYGLLKKIVIADRLNLFVKLAYSEFNQLDGGLAAAAAVLYTCQLYMEFSGTMDIVIGTAEIFGVRLPENFRQPFFSKTISEFWQRWHITLGTWFKDYIFYPMSMSKQIFCTNHLKLYL